MEGLIVDTTKAVLDKHEDSLSFLWSQTEVKHQQDIVNNLLKVPYMR